MRSLPFQEANRAWRTLQPTLFSRLYSTTWMFPPILRRVHREKEDDKFWFDLQRLVRSAGMPAVEYRPGTYLKVMLRLLYSMSIVALIPLGRSTHLLHSCDDKAWIPFLAVLIVTGLIIVWRFFKDEAQRHLLEYGILSIHSSAILWQAVVVAHYRSLWRLRDEATGVGWQGYARSLAEEAEELADHAFSIHEYVGSCRLDDGYGTVAQPG